MKHPMSKFEKALGVGTVALLVAACAGEAPNFEAQSTSQGVVYLSDIDSEEELQQAVELYSCGGEEGEESAKNPKINICHVPPGNPDAAHNICISIRALEAHLNHHRADEALADYLGECGAGEGGDGESDDGENDGEGDDGNDDGSDDDGGDPESTPTPTPNPEPTPDPNLF